MKTSESLTIGEIYTRRQLRELFEITDATIRTGVFRPRGHDSVWLFVTERKGPQETPYRDLLVDDLLEWDGQTSGKTDRLIVGHVAAGLELLVFYRRHKLEHLASGFRFEGPFEYESHQGVHPSHFVLRRVSTGIQSVTEDLESLRVEEEYFEGERQVRFTNYYERNPGLRRAAIARHGLKCAVCGFSFEAKYGQRGTGFVEVHHLKPVSRLGGEVKVDPETDMTVVCSNCHRMIHRRKDAILSIEEMRQLLQSR